jgi:hypothetical protein
LHLLYIFLKLRLNKNIIENYALLRSGYSLVTEQEQQKKAQITAVWLCCFSNNRAIPSFIIAPNFIQVKSSRRESSQRFTIHHSSAFKNYNILSALFSDCDLLATTFFTLTWA